MNLGKITCLTILLKLKGIFAVETMRYIVSAIKNKGIECLE